MLCCGDVKKRLCLCYYVFMLDFEQRDVLDPCGVLALGNCQSGSCCCLEQKWCLIFYFGILNSVFIWQKYEMSKTEIPASNRYPLTFPQWLFYNLPLSITTKQIPQILFIEVRMVQLTSNKPPKPRCIKCYGLIYEGEPTAIVNVLSHIKKVQMFVRPPQTANRKFL